MRGTVLQRGESRRFSGFEEFVSHSPTCRSPHYEATATIRRQRRCPTPRDKACRCGVVADVDDTLKIWSTLPTRGAAEDRQVILVPPAEMTHFGQAPDGAAPYDPSRYRRVEPASANRASPTSDCSRSELPRPTWELAPRAVPARCSGVRRETTAPATRLPAPTLAFWLAGETP